MTGHTALLQEFRAMPALDIHVHPPRRGCATAAEGDLLRLFTESDFAEQSPHLAHSLAAHRAALSLGELLGVEPNWSAIRAARQELGLAEWFRRSLTAANVRGLCLDYGLAAPDQLSREEMAALGQQSGAGVWEALRLEAELQTLCVECATFDDVVDRFRLALTAARQRGVIALKSVIAYRSGLGVAPVTAAEADGAFRRLKPTITTPFRLADKTLLDFFLLEALQFAAVEGMPVHFHTGLGDRDLELPESDPTRLRYVLEQPRFRRAPLLLLHNYPFVRQGAYLAHVYPNVFIELSLTTPFIGPRVEVAFAEAFELAPTSKLMYASDAFNAPDVMYLAAAWTREALARLFDEWLRRGYLTRAQATTAAEQVLWRNSAELHGVRLPAKGGVVQ